MMKNPEFFDKLTPMTHEEYIRIWRDEENKNGHDTDTWMLKRIDDLDEYGRARQLNYFLALLTQHGFNNVVLKDGGGVQDRISKILNEIDQFNDTPGGLASSEFTLGHLRRPRQLTVIDSPGYYPDMGSEKLYAVNQNRFHVFKRWIQTHSFQPVKVYYCEEPDKF